MEDINICCKLGELRSDSVPVISGHESYFKRAAQFPVDLDTYLKLKDCVKALGVTENFKEIVDYFKTPDGETPAGFCASYEFKADGLLLVDLKRNINYGKNSEKRATGVLFSADCANPYEIKAFQSLMANITTNPAIIYDTFINNEQANVGHLFHTREEVMTEIANVVGPGVDISVELNNPFASENQILEEVAQFEEILSPYRLVVKVMHLGPINQDNAPELISGTFSKRYNDTKAADACYSHELACMLRDHGYRVNFTLMAEPHQTAMALQVKPAFINTFMRNRYHHSEKIDELLKCYRATEEPHYLAQLRDYFIKNYYLSPVDKDMGLLEVKREAEKLLAYRGWYSTDPDGLDQARHNLRLIANSNLTDTRLIICSLDTDMYAKVDKMLMEPEFQGMTDRVVITASPKYLTDFTSSPAVLNYNRNFFKAASTSKT